MHFSFHQPPPSLAPWVKSIWCAQGTQAEFAAPEPIVPDGCVEIIFNLADRFADRQGRQPLALVVGQMTGPVTAVATGAVDLIGVRFWPGRAGAALRTPMWQLRDRLIDADHVLRGGGELIEQLRGTTPDRRLDRVAAALSHRFAAARNSAAVDHALHVIEQRLGAVSIDELARTVGISRRHLERRFKEEVGLGVKQMARIARVHATLHWLERRPVLSGAEISARCGYSDQAHMIRECKALTGRTPAGLMTSARSLGGLMREAAAIRST